MLKAIGILLVAICLLTIQVSAQQRRALSKPPIPGAGEIASPNQQKPAAHDQPAADSGTPAAPLVEHLEVMDMWVERPYLFIFPVIGTMTGSMDRRSVTSSNA